MSKDLIYIFGRRGIRRICVLVVVMFIGAMLEMLGLSLVVSVCSFLVNEGRMRDNAWVGLFSKITGLQPGNQMMKTMIIILVFVYLFKMVYLLAEHYVINHFIRDVQHGISVKLYNGVLRSPYEYFMKTSTAGVINLLNTDTARTATYLFALMQVVAEGFVMAVISLFLMVINPTMTLFVLSGIGISFLLTWGVVKPRVYRAGKRRQAANILRMKWVNQGIHGIKDVKVGRMEAFFCENYARADRNVVEAEAQNRFWAKAPNVCIETVMVICVLFYIMFLLLTGKNVLLFLPSLSALVVAAVRLLPTCNRVNANLTQMNHMRASVESIAKALKQMEEQRDSRYISGDRRKICLEDSIVADKVTFGYEGRSRAILNQADMEIAVGSSVGIIGPSGAGKTTLVDILLGLLRPQQGAVLVDGVNLEECCTSYLEKVAYIPQVIFLADDTVRNNVALGVPPAQIRDEVVWEALEKAALSGLVKSFPDGLDTFVGEGGIRLSGGERQRLGIARALYRGSSLIIFDEATSALDQETEARIIESIHSLKNEKTTVIISHRPSAVEECDKIYQVKRGNVYLVSKS